MIIEVLPFFYTKIAFQQLFQAVFSIKHSQYTASPFQKYSKEIKQLVRKLEVSTRKGKNMSIVNILIPFIGGLGMFIYGMQIMAQGLENAAGSRMRSLLEILTKNKFLGVLLGAGITAVIQSSSATTVMVVGFVNAGIMNLQQAMGVIMGANIGTTVTGWLVSSSEWAKFLSPVTLAPIAIMVGTVIMMMGKRFKTKEIAKIVFGFGLLFVGISTMSTSVAPLKENEAFCNIFVTLGNNPLLGILAGAVVTAVIQSSSASVGILQSLAAAGLVPFHAAIYIIMGQNIGTCITAILSGLGANRNAKTAGLMHLLFNIIGSVIFSIAAILYFSVANPEWAAGNITQTQIGLVHTLFNIATTLLLFPVSNYIITLAKKIAKVKDDAPESPSTLLDQRLLETPGIALSALNGELRRMAEIVADTQKLAVSLIGNPNAELISGIRDAEKKADKITEDITTFAIQLSTLDISNQEHQKTVQILQVVSDLERISDQYENIAEYVEQLMSKGMTLTPEAVKELTDVAELCVSCFDNSIKAYAESDLEYLKKTVVDETKIDQLEISLRSKNISRLTKHQCDAQSGILFQDILVSLERISDHARNIAEENWSQTEISTQVKHA